MGIRHAHDSPTHQVRASSMSHAHDSPTPQVRASSISHAHDSPTHQVRASSISHAHDSPTHQLRASSISHAHDSPTPQVRALSDMHMTHPLLRKELNQSWTLLTHSSDKTSRAELKKELQRRGGIPNKWWLGRKRTFVFLNC